MGCCTSITPSKLSAQLEGEFLVVTITCNEPDQTKYVGRLTNQDIPKDFPKELSTITALQEHLTKPKNFMFDRVKKILFIKSSSSQLYILFEEKDICLKKNKSLGGHT